MHRFYLDVWALDAGDAWAYFRDLVRDGLDAVESHGVSRVDAAAPWELDALRARLRGVETDLAHMMRVADDIDDDIWDGSGASLRRLRSSRLHASRLRVRRRGERGRPRTRRPEPDADWLAQAERDAPGPDDIVRYVSMDGDERWYQINDGWVS